MLVSQYINQPFETAFNQREGLQKVSPSTQSGLVEIEKQILEATAKHNVFLKELGLPMLPTREI